MPVLKLSVQNVSCESCEKVITRLVSRFDGAKFISISGDQKTLTLECSENDSQKIRTELSRYGYLDEGLTGSAFVQVAKKILSGSGGFKAENSFLIRVVLVFGVLFVLLAIAQLFVFQTIPQASKLWPVLALVPFGIAVNMASLWHARLLEKNFACNTGMMIGMTIGMIAGFMFGAVIGATNGMFIGSVSGMLVGMASGAWSGKSVGVMGIMEGMMAGLMGGLMGPMVSVMMIVDNLIPFMYLLFAACTVILAGMSYLIYKEAGPIINEENVPSFFKLLFAALVVMVVVIAIAIFAPKSATAWGLL